MPKQVHSVRFLLLFKFQSYQYFDHPWKRSKKKLKIEKKLLSAIRNVERTAWRIGILMLGCKWLICSPHSFCRTLLPRTHLMFVRPLFNFSPLTETTTNKAFKTILTSSVWSSSTRIFIREVQYLPKEDLSSKGSLSSRRFFDPVLLAILQLKIQ